MKKLLSIFFIVLIGITYFVYKKNDCFYDYFLQYNGEYCYVSSNDLELGRKVKNGDKYNYYFQTKHSDLMNFDYKQVTIFNCNNYLNKIMSDLSIHVFSIKNFENSVIYFCYSNRFSDFKIVDNNKINFQIVINDNYIIFGCPLIYSSF